MWVSERAMLRARVRKFVVLVKELLEPKPGKPEGLNCDALSQLKRAKMRSFSVI